MNKKKHPQQQQKRWPQKRKLQNIKEKCVCEIFHWLLIIVAHVVATSIEYENERRAVVNLIKLDALSIRKYAGAARNFT